MVRNLRVVLLRYRRDRGGQMNQPDLCSCGAELMDGGPAGMYCGRGWMCPDIGFGFIPERPSWDDYFLAMAKAVATRGDCRRRQVGAVLVRHDRSVASTGYNGSEPGGPSCLQGECPRGLIPPSQLPSLSSYDSGPGMCHAQHAEQNCLAFARENTTGYTLYVTCGPCPGCVKTAKAHLVGKIVWPDGWLDLRSVRLDV